MQKSKTMVKCKLYVWRKTKWSKGHVSLSLGNADYISWWPNRKWYHIGFTFDAKVNHTLEDDVRDEYGAEPEEYPMEMPLENVHNTVKWWKQTKISISDRQYNLMHKNCCTIVMEALKILSPKGTVLMSRFRYLVLTPSIVKWVVLNFVQSTKERSSNMEKKKSVFGMRAHASTKTRLTKKLGDVLMDAVERVKIMATIGFHVIKYSSIQVTGVLWIWVNKRIDDLIS